ncbi:hypothetical protein ACQEVF_22200 [Nonomuraea polychroma]|uniref:hypothetical protein n=1 Tax=Nonomuraea polychroma TaxID=46176 RepID=UPI003D941B5B
MSDFAALAPTGVVQFDRNDLASMSNEEIAAAHKAGSFQRYMEDSAYVRDRDTSQADAIAATDARVEAISTGIRSARDYDRFKANPQAFIREAITDQGDKPRQLMRADLQSMDYEEIEAARKAGQLNELLGIK